MKRSAQGTKCSKCLVESLLVCLPTYNVDVVHVSCRDLLTNLLYQVQGELDVVRLAGLGVDIPHRKNNRIYFEKNHGLPSSEVTIRSHNNAAVTKEVSEVMSVSMASPSCQVLVGKETIKPDFTVEMEDNGDLLTWRGGRYGHLGSPVQRVQHILNISLTSYFIMLTLACCSRQVPEARSAG